MNILHQIPRYLPAVGGAEQHMAEFSQRFVAAGHRVTVLTSDALEFEYLWDPAKRRIDEPEAIISGVQVKRFPVKPLPLAPTSYHAVRRLLWAISADNRLTRTISKTAPKLEGLASHLANLNDEFDIVAGMNIAYESVLLAGLEFARQRSIPFVAYPLTHLGAGDRPGSDPQSQFYTMAHQKRLVRDSTALIAQTQTEADFYTAAGLSAERITVAGPGVDPASVQGGDGAAWRKTHQVDGPIVACICTLSRDKGVPELVQAINHIDATLVLAGAVTDELRLLLNQVANSDKIRVLGRISAEEKRDLLAACDVFAMPSRIDSYGIAFLEAWACKTPVVGADSWGAADVISHGEDGLLAPFGDVDMLTSQIKVLIDDPAERQRLGENGYQKVMEQETWDHKFEQVLAVYEKLAGGKR